jgi:hypothetical protein
MGRQRHHLLARHAGIESLETRLCLSVNFAPPVQTPLGPALLMADGDFNRDGKLDLLVRGAGTNASTTAATVRMHAGLGNGRFATTGTPVWSGNNVSAIVVADFNEDGKLDAGFANDQSHGQITFAFGRGDGTFGGLGPLAVIPVAFVGSFPKGVVAADFNGDANVDLLVANNGQWTPAGSLAPATFGPAVLLGRGDGTFEPARKLYTAEPHTHVATGDIDGDGDADAVLAGPDLLSAGPLPQSARYALLNDGFGQFTVNRTVLFTFAVRGLHLGDLNGDGRADLAALQVLPTNTGPHGAATLHTFRSTNSGGFGSGAAAAAHVTRAAGLSAADFDRDGRLDFAVAGVGLSPTASVSAGVASVLRGNGDGTVATPKQFRTHGPPLSQLAADVNGDGRADFLTGSQTGVSTLLNVPATAGVFESPFARKPLAEYIGLTE